jgi:hypothetical protein
MTTSRPVWGADCPISMPLATGDPVQVQMFGFGMAQYRLVHDITANELEQLKVPIYAPDSPTSDTVADDADLDA